MPKKQTDVSLTSRAFKTRIHLNNVQAAWMRNNCIAARLAYNYAVAFIRDAYWFATPYEIRQWWAYERDDRHPWMKQRKLVMAGLNDVIGVDFANALKKWKADRWSPDSAPVFHGRGAKLSVTWTYITLTNRHIDDRTVTLPQRMGKARLAEPLRFAGKVMKVTFSYEGGKWFAAILTDTPVTSLPVPVPAPKGTVVGVDVGVVQYVSLSTGEQHPPAMDYQAELDKLAKLQRVLSRMEGPVKGKRKASRNWLKQNEKVAKQHRRIANLRRDYAEHITKDLAERFETIAVEKLAVKNMTRSAKGDAEKPGKNVAAKSGLNRSVLNGGFGMFRERLTSKVTARGGQVIAVNPAFTSQTCPACGNVHKANRPTQAHFECLQCGHTGNADVIAAQNILVKALA
jgi:putative transposase